MNCDNEIRDRVTKFATDLVALIQRKVVEEVKRDLYAGANTQCTAKLSAKMVSGKFVLTASDGRVWKSKRRRELTRRVREHNLLLLPR